MARRCSITHWRLVEGSYLFPMFFGQKKLGCFCFEIYCFVLVLLITTLGQNWASDGIFDELSQGTFFSLRMSNYFPSNFYFEKKFFFSVSGIFTASLLIPALYLRKRITLFFFNRLAVWTHFSHQFFLKLKTLRWKRKLQFWHSFLNFSLKVLENL